FDLSRSAGPPPVVDADEVGAANMILTNGARLYVDHAHPEYSDDRTVREEIFGPVVVVLPFEMEAAARHVASVPGAAKLQLYKNNIDNKGSSYGSHENYLMLSVNSHSSVRYNTPFGGFKQSGLGRELGPDAPLS
ncbi:aldehyde dehydrogenase family protein, partial [Mycolicibacter minnesotensis]|uniref:aldehyde dehydrogenase family protein n=1 Tax=Mycolicibacter minnesotensis TaxID=1118379 RepID=UPI0021F312DE